MDEELDLLDLFFTFLKKKYWLIGAVLVGAIIGFIYTKYIVVPQYTSSVTLILSKPSEQTGSSMVDSSGAITQSDITLNQKLISTYGEILKSRKVAKEVIDDLNLEMTYGEIKNCVGVSFVKDSDVIKLSVTTQNPELSATIADKMTEAFSKEIVRIYNIQNVSIIDNAEINHSPVNISYGKNIVIFAVICFVLVAGVIFLFYYFDNTIKTEENIQKLTGLPVLCTIPIGHVNNQKGVSKYA